MLDVIPSCHLTSTMPGMYQLYGGAALPMIQRVFNHMKVRHTKNHLCCSDWNQQAPKTSGCFLGDSHICPTKSDKSISFSSCSRSPMVLFYKCCHQASSEDGYLKELKFRCPRANPSIAIASRLPISATKWRKVFTHDSGIQGWHRQCIRRLTSICRLIYLCI